MRLRVIGEGLDSILPYHLRAENRRTTDYEFRVGDINYVVCIEKIRGEYPYTSPSFYAQREGGQPRMDRTGTGSARAVFATVLHILEQYMVQHRPPLVYFSGALASRQRLYDRLASAHPELYWKIRPAPEEWVLVDRAVHPDRRDALALVRDAFHYTVPLV